MAPTRRPTAARLGLSALATTLAAFALAACGAGAGTTTTDALSRAERLLPVEQAAVTKAEASVAVHLPSAAGQPAPTLPSDAFARPLPPHQVLGFLPYWEVGDFTPDYQSLTTLAYWAVTLSPGGSIARDGTGWSDLSRAALGLDVRQAHAAGDRVLLTIFSDNPRILHSVSASPGIAGRRLADDAAALLSAGGFDGVDLDLEGESTADRAGFVRFVASFSHSLRSFGR